MKQIRPKTSMVAILLVMCFAGISMAASEINWQVISGGATNGTSANFSLRGTTGQVAVGVGASTSYGVHHGYWQTFGPITCCVTRGDVNHNGAGPNIQDLTFLVAYLFGGGAEPPCPEEGDVNGNGAGPNIQDLTFLVAYLFGGGAAPPPC